MPKFNLFKLAQAQPGQFNMNQPVIQGAMESVTPEVTTEESLEDGAGIGMDGQTQLLMNPGQSDVDSEIETLSVPLFDNHVQMYEKLKSMSTGDTKSSMNAAWNNYFAPTIGETEIGDDFKSGLGQFFDTDSDSEDAVDIANRLYDMYAKIHPSHKGSEAEQETINEELDVATASTLDVIKMAQKMAKSQVPKIATGSFNLKKTAQHKGFDSSNVITGPSQTSLSPFTRDIQGGMHLIEQNKGFGLKIDDILDINFEAIWRGNIMDKYNQPYRDEQGNYVGGYINRRFEVDRNIPVGNNLQLLPGTRHRPWMPEYSILESRMESARGNKDKLINPFTFAKVSIGPFNLKKKSK